MSAPLLKPGERIEIPATTEPFVVRDHFHNSERALSLSGGWFFYVCGNFAHYLLGKVEPPRQATTLVANTLTRKEWDVNIIVSLGEAAAETTMAEIYALMQKVRTGEPSGLSFARGRNTFYVRDGGNNLWALRVTTNMKSWTIVVRHLAKSYAREGSLVYSRVAE